MEAIKDPALESVEDKLRLFIIFYLSAPDAAMTKTDVEEFERVLKDQGADLSALQYVKR